MMQQRNCKSLRVEFQLIPPLSKDFTTYGGKDIVERARKWALRNRYLLVEGLPRCAHGLYLMSPCPNHCDCHSIVREFDHTDIWIQVLESENRAVPFILSHPYVDQISDETKLYARSHGLELSSPKEDGWYANKSIPVRMDIGRNWPLWPIEAEATLMIQTQPIVWPDVPVVADFDLDQMT